MAEQNGEIVETLGGEQVFTGTVAGKDPMQRTQIPAPDGTPVKFWDADKGTIRTDELLKSYAELESKMRAEGLPKDPPPAEEKPAEEKPAEEKPAEEKPAEEKPGEEKPAEEKPAEEKPAEEKPSEAVDLQEAMGKAQQVYAEKGELPPEARDPFIKAGFSNEQIDLYIAGVKAYEQGLQQAAVKAAGVQSYDEVVEATKWAADNWSEKKILAFNAQTGDVETIGNAVMALFADYRAANPTDPGEGRLANINGGTSHGDVYTREAEFTKDLEAADKARDPDARRQAVAKMGRSLKAKSIVK